MASIRILIVEDDKDWQRGLTAYLSKEADIEVTARARTKEEALIAIEQENFDVALMDIMLGEEASGIELAQRICQDGTARVIMLTSLQEKEMIFDAFKVGAVDYLVKSDFEDIPEAIRSAYRKESPMNAFVAQQMREEFRRLKKLEHDFRVKEMKDLITPAELQVLQMIDKGYTQTDIADKLFVSLRTIKVHVGHILRKMGSGSSKEAAKKAREEGLFDK